MLPSDPIWERNIPFIVRADRSEFRMPIVQLTIEDKNGIRLLTYGKERQNKREFEAYIFCPFARTRFVLSVGERKKESNIVWKVEIYSLKPSVTFLLALERGGSPKALW